MTVFTCGSLGSRSLLYPSHYTISSFSYRNSYEERRQLSQNGYFQHIEWKIKHLCWKCFSIDSERKFRLHQLSGIYPADIVIPCTNAEIALLWTENEHSQTT